jgi:Rrf2 family cysteine metabolism transcriptional repressor
MRISAKGEYAAKAVLYLSLKYPEVVTIHEVAENHRIPLKYLEQILLALKKADLLESRRGVHGGYTLARPPAQISVGEVVRAVDGRFSRTHCLETDHCELASCPKPAACGLREVWKNLETTVEQMLFETSYADVCGHSRPPQFTAEGLAQEFGASR